MNRFNIQKVVVIVDIQEVLKQQNAAGYVAAISEFVRNLLSRCTTAWGFKFFDSSISSYRSDRLVYKLLGDSPRMFWAFGLEPEAHSLFGDKLRTLASSPDVPLGEANADTVMSSLRDMFGNYMWNPLLSPRAVQELRGQHWKAKRNLVVLFSSLPPTAEKFSSFLQSSVTMSEEEIEKRFAETFQVVCKGFQKRDIHACWVQAPGACPTPLQRKCVRRLGFSFTELDTVLLGSLAVPRCLVLPCITWLPESLSKSGTSAVLKIHLLSKRSRSRLHNVCKVDVAPLDLHNRAFALSSGWTDVTVSVAAALPRKRLGSSALQSAQAFYMRSLPAEEHQLDTSAEAILLQRLRFHHCDNGAGGTAQLGFQLFLAQLARSEAVGLADIELSKPGDEVKHLKGVLEPFTLDMAVLYAADNFGDIDCFLSSTPAAVGSRGLKRKSHDGGGDGEAKRARPPSTGKPVAEQLVWSLSDASSWPEAWASYLTFVTAAAVQKYTRRIEDTIGSEQKKLFWRWNVQVWKSFQSSLLDDVAKWLGVELVKTTEPVQEDESREATKTVEAEARITLFMADQTVALRGFARTLVEEAKVRYNNFDFAIVGLDGDGQYERKLRNEKLAMFVLGTYSDSDQRLQNFLAEGEGARGAWLSGMKYAVVSVGSGTYDGYEMVASLVDASLEKQGASRLGTCRAFINEEQEAFSAWRQRLWLGLDEVFTVYPRVRAQAYVSSVKEKLSSFIHLPDMDLGVFAKQIVADTMASVQVLSCEGTGAVDSKDDVQVKLLILESPGTLAKKYFWRSQYSSEQKVKEHLFQIKLRLELIAAGEPNKESQEELVEEVCDLLYAIQFNLPGRDIFEMESLLDFSDRIIHKSYNAIIPDVIDEIYTKMEFKGFGGDTGVDACTMFLLEDVEERSPQAAQAPAPEDKAQTVQEKRMLALRRSHFASRRQKLRYTVRPPRRPLVKPAAALPPPKRAAAPKSTDYGSVEFVADTPMSVNSRPQPRRPAEQQRSVVRLFT